MAQGDIEGERYHDRMARIEDELMAEWVLVGLLETIEAAERYSANYNTHDADFLINATASKMIDTGDPELQRLGLESIDFQSHASPSMEAAKGLSIYGKDELVESMHMPEAGRRVFQAAANHMFMVTQQEGFEADYEFAEVFEEVMTRSTEELDCQDIFDQLAGRIPDQLVDASVAWFAHNETKGYIDDYGPSRLLLLVAEATRDSDPVLSARANELIRIEHYRIEEKPTLEAEVARSVAQGDVDALRQVFEEDDDYDVERAVRDALNVLERRADEFESVDYLSEVRLALDTVRSVRPNFFITSAGEFDYADNVAGIRVGRLIGLSAHHETIDEVAGEAQTARGNAMTLTGIARGLGELGDFRTFASMLERAQGLSDEFVDILGRHFYDAMPTDMYAAPAE